MAEREHRTQEALPFTEASVIKFYNDLNFQFSSNPLFTMDARRRTTLVGFQELGYGAFKAVQTAGLIPSGEEGGFTLLELGPGTAALQLSELAKLGIRPASFLGVEEDPNTVNLANSLIAVLPEKGNLTQGDSWEVVEGDETRSDNPANIAANNLVIQYKGASVVAWVERNMKQEDRDGVNGVGVICDIGHAPFENRFTDGVMPIGTTGLSFLRSKESFNFGPLGEVCAYEIRPNLEVFNGRERIFVSKPGASHYGWGTVVDGKFYPYAYLPKKGQLSDEELAVLAANRRVLYQIYDSMAQHGWNGNHIFMAPQWIEELGNKLDRSLYSVTMIDTHNGDWGFTGKVRASAPAVMPIAHKRHLLPLLQQSPSPIHDIGGEIFPNVDVLVEKTNALLPKLREVPFSGPPNMLVNMLKDGDEAQRLAQTIEEGNF